MELRNTHERFLAEKVKIKVYFLPLPFCEQADMTGQLNEPPET